MAAFRFASQKPSAYLAGAVLLLALASCRTSSLRQAPVSARMWNAIPLAGTHPVPGTTLSVRNELDLISIEAADGGGTGAVRLPRGAAELGPASRLSIEPRSGGRFIVKVQPSIEPGIYYTVIDSNGVRLDDSLTDRVLHHRIASLASLLSLVFAAVSYVRSKRQKAATKAT